MDGCRWVEMDADGCDRVYADRGNAKQGKKMHKCECNAIFSDA